MRKIGALLVILLLAILMYACQLETLERRPLQFNEAPNIPNNIAIHVRDHADTGYMQLVNRAHAVSGEPRTGLLQSAWPTVPVSRVEGMYLHRSALAAVEAMFASAQAAGVGPFHVTSGFRDVERQRELYNNGANSDFVLPPGHSEHHTGLAVDIMADGICQWELSDSPQGQWLAANSYRYGLIYATRKIHSPSPASNMNPGIFVMSAACTHILCGATTLCWKSMSSYCKARAAFRSRKTQLPIKSCTCDRKMVYYMCRQSWSLAFPAATRAVTL